MTRVKFGVRSAKVSEILVFKIIGKTFFPVLSGVFFTSYFQLIFRILYKDFVKHWLQKDTLEQSWLNLKDRKKRSFKHFIYIFTTG